MFQVLRFKAWFKETVHESPIEHYRVRPVDIFYYLEDDSMAVVEPVVENSGLPQGITRLLQTHKNRINVFIFFSLSYRPVCLNMQHNHNRINVMKPRSCRMTVVFI